MNRSNYSDDFDIDDQWASIRWRGAVESAIRGKRGQSFLREMVSALDALPEKKLVANDLVVDGEFCAIGAVGRARGIAIDEIDPEDAETIAGTFGISDALTREIMWMNDEGVWAKSAEDRFAKMRSWVESRIKPVTTDEEGAG